MTELQMHPPANVAVLQHRTTPGRSVNVHQHRLRTKSRMPVQQRIALSATHERIYAILSLDFDNCSFWQAVHGDSTFDLRLNDVAVDLVTQVRIGSEYLRDEIDRFCHSCLYHNRSPKRRLSPRESSTCGPGGSRLIFAGLPDFIDLLLKFIGLASAPPQAESCPGRQPRGERRRRSPPLDNGRA